ncbi:NADPH-dependent F420 reductase [Paramicrobacterium fandaimingii]|uniref:NADPH-dependent F420 reductase n=1 Tax=Paramicrobacterium fandaimingii TaxID=2708079 RepID=UPI0014219F39|nr:NAD(P)-binding domain-containing protein [Microbacterium fandaimingii]
MTTMGIIGAGDVGSQLARAAIANGYTVVIANSRGPETLAELAGKIVLDTNNYMRWRDGHFSVVASGEKTIHELRQQQLPTSKVASAFTHIQAPTLLRFARHAGSPERLALATSSNHPDAVELVTELYDRLGYDTVDNSPVSQSWRVGPGTLAWNRSLRGGQNRETLIAGLAAASAAWDE